VGTGEDYWHDTVTITLTGESQVWVGGHAKEGHPELGCEDGVPCEKAPGQDKEEFRVLFDTQELGVYYDKGLDRNAWLPFGDWPVSTLVGPGPHTIAVEYLYKEFAGMSTQSVDYKLSFCTFPVATPTPAPQGKGVPPSPQGKAGSKR
jgi:hypothetical protein